jgi:hypothetical protein
MLAGMTALAIVPTIRQATIWVDYTEKRTASERSG